MGTSICGVWIEQKKSLNDPNSEEVGAWECVARLSWGRDYLLFDAMDGGRHGEQGYTLVRESRTPIGLSYEYDRHMTGRDLGEGMWEYKHSLREQLGLTRDSNLQEEYVKYLNSDDVNWDKVSLYTDLIVLSESCYPHYLTLEEAEKVQEIYIEETAAWQEANPEFSREEIDKIPGMKTIPYMAGNSPRHEGLDLAITIMKWAEANNNNNRATKNRPTRIVYCYNY